MIKTKTIFNLISVCYLLIIFGLLVNYNEFNYYGVTAQLITCVIYIFLLNFRNIFTWFLLLTFIIINFLSYYFLGAIYTESDLIYRLFVEVFPFHYFNTIGVWGYKKIFSLIYCLTLIGIFIFLLTKRGKHYYNFGDKFEDKKQSKLIIRIIFFLIFSTIIVNYKTFVIKGTPRMSDNIEQARELGVLKHHYIPSKKNIDLPQGSYRIQDVWVEYTWRYVHYGPIRKVDTASWDNLNFRIFFDRDFSSAMRQEDFTLTEFGKSIDSLNNFTAVSNDNELTGFLDKDYKLSDTLVLRYQINSIKKDSVILIKQYNYP